MSTTTQTIAAERVSKKEARKAEKAKLKKDKAEVGASIAAAEDPIEDEGVTADESAASPDKKRKRKEENADELEIDVNLPEPPSKKALRKAKKQKVQVSDDAGENATKSDGAEGSAPAATAQKESAYGIWIGNLPWTITKAMLSAFFTTNAEAMGNSIPAASITRVHLPAPINARPDREGNKPVNKGFAYVDFDSQPVLQAALALSETPFGGRKVLIKEAKNFEGRPDKDVAQGSEPQSNSHAEDRNRVQPKKVSRRVFVGNLGFDVTKEDLETHYATCGAVEDIHMATFEDTGKCKGFAWVTFQDTTAAEAAVQGWVRKEEEDDQDESTLPAEEEGEQENAKPRKDKKPRTRKWFVNRLLGRQLRCEFAEDASTRYKKRFGKDAAGPKPHAGGEGDEGQSRGSAPRKDTSGTKMSGKDRRRADKIAELGSFSGAAYGGDKGEKRYRTGGIAKAEGTKITFD